MVYDRSEVDTYLGIVDTLEEKNGHILYCRYTF